MVAVQPRSVLIADDDPGIRESLQEVLDQEGWETCTAEDGRQAIEIIRVRVFRVAMVDLQMPEVSGLETVRELHSIVRALPVVAMTADRDRWAKADVVAAGAFDLIWKPLRLADVRSVLERALRSAS